MDQREKSRRDWEQEIVRRQQNITPADYPEGLHYAKLSGIPKITSQVRFWIGVVLIAVGISVFRSAIPAASAVAVVIVAAGIFASISAMR